MIKILTLLMVLTGCAAGPDYEKPEVIVPEKWEYSINTADKVAVKDVSTWWKTLGDESLNTLIDEALNNNFSLKESIYRVEQARLNVESSRGGYLPTLGAFLEADRTKFSDTGIPSSASLPENPINHFSTGIGVALDLDVFGSIRRQVEASDAMFKSKIHKYKLAKIILVNEVINTYLQIISANKRIEIAEDYLKILKNTLNISSKRFSAGTGSKIDVFQVRAEFEQTKALVPEILFLRESRIQKMKLLLGRADINFLSLLTRDPRREKFPKIKLDILPAEIIRLRPDIQVAESKLMFESAQIGVLDSQLWPQFKLVGTFGYDSTGDFKFSGSENSIWSFGLPITWNIFDGMRIRRASDAQQKSLEASVFGYQNTILKSMSEVEQRISEYNNNAIRIEHMREAEKNAKKSLKLTQRLYQQGAVDLTRVLDTQRSFLRTSFSVVSIKKELGASIANLYLAIGAGWSYKLDMESQFDEPIELNESEEKSDADKG